MHVPGWHEATEELRSRGRVKMLGVVEEQHPERARLFMQWKGMDWPLLVDSLNLLEVPLVPITLLVDEDGRARRAPRLRTAEEIEALVREFVGEAGDRAERRAAQDAEQQGAEGVTDSAAAGTEIAASPPARDAPASAWREHGRRLFLTGGVAALDRAIAAYRTALLRAPDDPGGWAHFRLGVLYRARHDSPHRRPGDFQAAVDAWQAALDRDPNNYIFRRRIQQYGPRLEKPYPFYDWVEEARREVRARGGQPVELTVDPGGAEIARPAGSGEGPLARTDEPRTAAEPDPEGRIHRDPGELVRTETTVVPGHLSPGGAVRVHLAFRPEESLDAHWNNEVDGLTVWVQPPPGLEVEPRRHVLPNPPERLSEEIRRLDFEVEAAEDLPEASAGRPLELPLYALYYVCEGIDGTCLYRRQDLEVEIPLADAGSGSDG